MKMGKRLFRLREGIYLISSWSSSSASTVSNSFATFMRLLARIMQMTRHRIATQKPTMVKRLILASCSS